MKIIIGMVILLVLIVSGCASGRYSASSYQDRQALQEAIRDNPDFYRIWEEEKGR
jgi:PBP1b-binding outer membrane lipoprotein LpoB